MKNFIYLICLFVLIVLAMTACQQTGQPVEEDEKAAPSDSSAFTLQYKRIGSTGLNFLNLTVFPSQHHKSKTPAIMFFFGGGWRKGSVNQFKAHAEYFAQRGLTGILVDYRVSSRHGTTPFDAVEDAKDAIKFVTDHANELGVDENKIVVSGGSAGGHLALMSSFWAQESVQRPAGLVLFNPVIDTGPEGYGYERLGERYDEISPIDNIPEHPSPMVIFLGTDDSIIDVEQAEDFCSEVKRYHGQCQLELYKGQGHGFFNYWQTENFIQTVREADRFLIQQQILEGNPNIKEWVQRQN